MFTHTGISKMIFFMEIGSYFHSAGLHYQLIEKGFSENEDCIVYEFERGKLYSLPAYYCSGVCERVD